MLRLQAQSLFVSDMPLSSRIHREDPPGTGRRRRLHRPGHIEPALACGWFRKGSQQQERSLNNYIREEGSQVSWNLRHWILHYEPEATSVNASF